MCKDFACTSIEVILTFERLAHILLSISMTVSLSSEFS